MRARKIMSSQTLVWMSVILLLLSQYILAAGPPLEEIRQAVRDHLPHDSFNGSEKDELLLILSEENLDMVLRDLDPHARYFPERHVRTRAQMNDLSAGIGAELFFRDKDIFLSPFQGGALARSGIEDRVRLLSVDGIPVHGLNAEQLAELLHGAVGSPVRLVIAPSSGESSRNVSLVREVLHPLAVAPIHVDETVVLQIRRFEAGKTCAALRASIEYLGSTRQPLVLDLRESTGGDLHEALDCAALFLAEGRSLGGVRRDGTKEVMYRAPGGKKFDAALALLVGPDTASAAEVFARALRYHGRAVLIGRQTFGKYTTQTDLPLSDGSLLRLTNGVILSPDGTICQGQGLHPDQLVESSVLYDTPVLARLALHVDMPKYQHPSLENQFVLRELQADGRLTVRALRAWDRLPSRYVRLMLDLLALDLDLLAADSRQVQLWAEEAASTVGPLAPFSVELAELAAFMTEESWDAEQRPH